MAGCRRIRVTKNNNHIPILGEIPVLGWLFSSHHNVTTKQELLIFLRPVVLRDTDAANANAVESVDKLPLTKENADLVRKVTGHQVPPSDEDKQKP